MPRTVRALLLSFALCAVVSAAPALASQPARTEVVVTLEAPSLARAVQTSRVLSPELKSRRLDLRSVTSRAYLADVRRAQSVVERRINAAIPLARVRWHYSIVLNGLAVVLPLRDVPKLSRIRGISSVQHGGRFGATLDRSPSVIGADDLWGGPTFATAGQGVKIGIIDDGVDQSHPFFNPAGYTYPAGFPKGQRPFTTPKVIVARAFAPASTRWQHARKPFDPVESVHGTHVAGIAAGNVTPPPVDGRGRLTGTAPRAYIGNYKVLSTPSDFGLIDNAGEVIAGIEAAVRDGMDVINMSFGEFETDPARNVVDEAVDGAAAAGVVPVAAAGNSYDDLGRGSIGSPATAVRAIAAAAVTKSDVLASFSSSGPTPMSLRMKPQVSAPGASILSSVPEREGTWASFSGTSMASPHVAGAAALLLQQHPGWTVDEVTSALVQTGRPVTDPDTEQETPATREGGGLVDLLAADDPLVFVSPATVSLGLLPVGTSRRVSVDIQDAGGGGGSWNVSLDVQPSGGLKLTVPAAVSVPGSFELVADATQGATEADVTGHVVLRRGAVTRRIPLWLRVVRLKLGPPARVLTKQGRYEGNVRNGKSNVSAYRYPDDPSGLGVSNSLPGPEQVFRVRVQGAVANVGVRITRLPRGVSVTPRLVFAGNENRLTGVPALPVDVNPYRGDSYGEPRLVVAANRPSAGTYDVVFETRSRAAAGPFSFRLWIGDSTPPRVKLLTPVVKRALVLSVADSGSGVDPLSMEVLVDGRRSEFTFASGRLRVPLDTPSRGSHRVSVTVADFQETKNSESVVRILPNTRIFRATFRVR
jgi:subtilisin family serine protease